MSRLLNCATITETALDVMVLSMSQWSRKSEIPMPWIVSDPEHLGGAPRVRATRIAVALLLEWIASGITISEIVNEYPSLTEEAIRGTLEELAHSDLLTAR
jgi:uncharacterized protein (DUF433 family)